MDRKHADAIRRHLPPGFQLMTRRCNHASVIGPDGELLRQAGGMPVMLASTPGDHRALRNDIARIRRALRARKEGGDA